MILHIGWHRHVDVPAAGSTPAESSATAVENIKKDRPHVGRGSQRDETESLADGMPVVIHRHNLRVTQVLSLMFLGLALTLITHQVLLEWALNTYAWPHVESVTGRPIIGYDYPMQPGFTLLGLGFVAIILVAKELLAEYQGAKLIVNASCVVAFLSYAVLHAVMSVAVLVRVMEHLMASPG